MNEPDVTHAQDVDSKLNVQVKTYRHLDPRTFRRVTKYALIAYITSRLMLLIAAFFISVNHKSSLISILTPWDGKYYISIAANGYPRQYYGGASPLAFFPVFPIIAKGLTSVFRLSVPWALVAISWAGGACASVLAGVLAACHLGERRGYQAAVLFAIFPGSVVAGLAYPEGIGITLAIATFLALDRRRWLLAGVLGALVTATLSPLTLPIFAVALLTTLKEKSAGSLVPVVLIPLGALSYFGYLWWWTGSPFTWFNVERIGWLARLTLPTAKFTSWTDTAFSTPGATVATIASVVVALLSIVALLRIRAPITWLVFSALIFLAVTFDGGNWLEPRFIWDAFPAVIALGASVPRRAFPFVAATSMICLILLILAYSPANFVFWNP